MSEDQQHRSKEVQLPVDFRQAPTTSASHIKIHLVVQLSLHLRTASIYEFVVMLASTRMMDIPIAHLRRVVILLTKTAPKISSVRSGNIRETPVHLPAFLPKSVFMFLRPALRNHCHVLLDQRQQVLVNAVARSLKLQLLQLRRRPQQFLPALPPARQQQVQLQPQRPRQQPRRQCPL